MQGKRRQHRPEFNTKVAISTLKGEKTANQLASEYDTHPLVFGQLKVEVDQLRSLVCLPDVRRAWIEPNQAQISLRPPCEPLALARSTVCYEPASVWQASPTSLTGSAPVATAPATS